MNLGVNEIGQANLDDIFAGTFPTIEMPVTVASGQNLKRGTCLGKVTASGKYKIWDSSANDGSETLAGILGVDCDASQEDENAFMYITGEFKKSKLIAAHTIQPGVYQTNCFIVIKEG